VGALRVPGAEAEVLGAADEMGTGDDLVHGIGRWGLEDGSRFPFVLSFVDFLGRIYSFLGQVWAESKRGVCNEPSPRRLRTGKLGKMHAAMMYIGCMRV